MSDQVSVNEEVCQQVAAVVKGLKLKKSFYNRPFLTVNAPFEIRLRGFFYAVAICHQTYNLAYPLKNLYGWDYLEDAFTSLIHSQDEILSSGYFCTNDPSFLEEKLAAYFSPDGTASNSTLDRIQERTSMLIELDQFVLMNYQSKLTNLVKNTEGLLFSNGQGYYEILPGVKAFEDPMRKKITFLLKLLEEAGMIKVLDPVNFIPIMDYHMQRVLLRMGCVNIYNQELKDKLTARQTLSSDAVVRIACIEAFKYIAVLSGFPVTKMNDFFWSLGRSCCHEKPLCQVGKCEKEPCTFKEIINITDHSACAFQQVCKGAVDQEFRNLWQPVVETHYY
ncbi:MAG: hypothetical protein HXX13_15595 [Bacteroidetes bacterium]|nr:hypothetical protein [Bacteroidota bacterium]